MITDSVITICYIAYIEYKYTKPFKSQITELSASVFYLLLPYRWMLLKLYKFQAGIEKTKNISIRRLY